MMVHNTHMSSKTINTTIRNMGMAAFKRDGVTRGTAGAKPRICAGRPPGRRRGRFAIDYPFTAYDCRDQWLVCAFYSPIIPHEIGLLYPAVWSRLRLPLELTNAAKAYIWALLHKQSLRPLQPVTPPLRVFRNGFGKSLYDVICS